MPASPSPLGEPGAVGRLVRVEQDVDRQAPFDDADRALETFLAQLQEAQAQVGGDLGASVRRVE